jgi:hypothetical protein
MRDGIGRLPIIKTKKQALQEIYKIANDKRTHVLTDDCLDWMETKMRVIRMLVRKGMVTK